MAWAKEAKNKKTRSYRFRACLDVYNEINELRCKINPQNKEEKQNDNKHFHFDFLLVMLIISMPQSVKPCNYYDNDHNSSRWHLIYSFNYSEGIFAYKTFPVEVAPCSIFSITTFTFLPVALFPTILFPVASS